MYRTVIMPADIVLKCQQYVEPIIQLMQGVGVLFTLLLRWTGI